jgi:hypothetical protein
MTVLLCVLGEIIIPELSHGLLYHAGSASNGKTTSSNALLDSTQLFTPYAASLYERSRPSRQHATIEEETRSSATGILFHSKFGPHT